MLKLAIIGTGNIGSRHLQALAFLEESAQLHLVDPSQENLKTAVKRLESVEAPNMDVDLKIHLASALPHDVDFDLVIVATSSAARSAICHDLLARCSIRFLVLEKFLFQCREDYVAVGTALNGAGLKTWVNHWITDTYAFNRAASMVIGCREVFAMKVFGDGWGLCCNSVHHLEFFDHLCGRQEIILEETAFEAGAISSKRPGHYEINGRMMFRAAESGATLELVCGGQNSNSAEMTTRIEAGNNCVEMTIHFGRLACVFDVDGRQYSEDFILYPQSRRSQDWVHDLILKGECGLPDYDRSCYQHLLVFDAFVSHFQKGGLATDGRCPVT